LGRCCVCGDVSSNLNLECSSRWETVALAAAKVNSALTGHPTESVHNTHTHPACTRAHLYVSVRTSGPPLNFLTWQPANADSTVTSGAALGPVSGTKNLYSVCTRHTKCSAYIFHPAATAPAHSQVKGCCVRWRLTVLLPWNSGESKSFFTWPLPYGTFPVVPHHFRLVTTTFHAPIPTHTTRTQEEKC
jgi:hypothetical protein